jgi:hypothetical protein
MSRGSPSQGDLQHQWIVDSGASRTMCSNHDWFLHFSHLPVPMNIALRDNSSIQGTGVGQIGVSMKAAGTWHHAMLQDVLYVPELHRNLLSVSQLARCSADVRFAKGGCQIYNQRGTLTCEGSLRAGTSTLCPFELSHLRKQLASQLSSSTHFLLMVTLPLRMPKSLLLRATPLPKPTCTLGTAGLATFTSMPS